jgi:hypothetical protein
MLHLAILLYAVHLPKESAKKAHYDNIQSNLNNTVILSGPLNHLRRRHYSKRRKRLTH